MMVHIVINKKDGTMFPRTTDTMPLAMMSMLIPSMLVKLLVVIKSPPRKAYMAEHQLVCKAVPLLTLSKIRSTVKVFLSPPRKKKVGKQLGEYQKAL